MTTKHVPILVTLLGLLVGSIDAGTAVVFGPGDADGKDPEQKVGLIQNDKGSFKGYTLLTPMMSKTTYLIDNDGRVVKKWECDYPGLSAYLLENGRLLRTASPAFGGNRTFHGGGAGGRVQELTWDGALVWDFEYSNDDRLLHHDIEPLPSGNVLMIAWERKTAEEAIAAGRDPGLQGDGDLWADHIIEVKPTGKTTGEIVWEWHVWDHLIQDADPSKANYGAVADHPELVNINPIDWVGRLSPKELEKLASLGYLRAPTGPTPRRSHPDWNHTNAISYNPELDQIVLTVLGFNEIWMIDHSTTTKEAAGHAGGRSGKGGDLLYRWGNPMAYRAGAEEDQQLFAHHDANWIPGGPKSPWHLLVFNNGRGRPDGDYSSVDEIVLPVDQRGKYTYEPGTAFGPDRPVWSYTAPRKADFYSLFISGAQRLPNGNTLICSGASGTLFEVTEKGEVVWKYVSPVEAGGFPGPGIFGPGMFGPGMGRGRRGTPLDLDSDGDGLLTREEASGLPFMNGDLFKRLDANGDGVLSQEELDRGAPTGMPGRGMGGRRRGIPPEVDSDRDGVVTRKEASALPFMNDETFKQLDADGNGVLNEEELPEGPPPGMPAWGMPGPGMGGPPMGGPPMGGPGMGGPGMRGPGGGLFKARRYAPDFPGLAGKDLTPGEPIKANPEAPVQRADQQ
jgi:hypothetical protein